VRQFGKQSVPLITGDGGFDNSGDYNHQEENSLRLIYSEICLALLLQKEGGTFICKLFDTFESETISLLYLLHESYETLSFYKPGVSRWSNSEKYVVCQGFKGYPIPMMNRMLRHFETGGLHYEVPPGFYWRILEVVRRYGETQMWSIQKGLDAIRHKAFAKGPTPLQLKIAKGWCLAYDVPLNAHCRYLRP
jgi:hypothetical protein